MLRDFFQEFYLRWPRTWITCLAFLYGVFISNTAPRSPQSIRIPYSHAPCRTYRSEENILHASSLPDDLSTMVEKSECLWHFCIIVRDINSLLRLLIQHKNLSRERSETTWKKIANELTIIITFNLKIHVQAFTVTYYHNSWLMGCFLLLFRMQREGQDEVIEA